jgi:hypothetical protein
VLKIQQEKLPEGRKYMIVQQDQIAVQLEIHSDLYSAYWRSRFVVNELVMTVEQLENISPKANVIMYKQKKGDVEFTETQYVEFKMNKNELLDETVTFLRIDMDELSVTWDCNEDIGYTIIGFIASDLRYLDLLTRLYMQTTEFHFFSEDEDTYRDNYETFRKVLVEGQ